jgi:hypothetical protein
MLPSIRERNLIPIEPALLIVPLRGRDASQTSSAAVYPGVPFPPVPGAVHDRNDFALQVNLLLGQKDSRPARSADKFVLWRR